MSEYDPENDLESEEFAKIVSQVEMYWDFCAENNLDNTPEDMETYLDMIDEGMDEQTMIEVFKL
ncbi:MAG: hypothetical protein PF440_03075 [Thiomicrorhabdus sp.]|jgi:hypothetical protein|nr:hypothetical protein [Thiomicrorhabdus sp.]